MQKAIRISVQGAANLPIDTLEPFQGDLKTLERSEYEGLRKNIEENGFSFTIHVWQHEGKNYIIDGHQRLFALKQMRDLEGYLVPEVPVSLVMADSFEQAKRKILAGTSQFGKMTEKSLFEFAKMNDIPLDYIASTLKFPEIKMEKLTTLFNPTEIVAIPVSEASEEKDMKSSSEGVKQLVLFFDLETYGEFNSMVSDLGKAYGKDNVTDTVMEIVKERHAQLMLQ